MFWKKKEPRKPTNIGELHRLSGRTYHASRKLIDENYPGGSATFDKDLEADPVQSVLNLMDGLREKDRLGLVDQAIEAIWEKVPVTAQKTIAGTLFETSMRISRELERRGMSGEQMLAADYEKSEQEAKELIRQWRENPK